MIRWFLAGVLTGYAVRAAAAAAAAEYEARVPLPPMHGDDVFSRLRALP